jgi:hypothetical protein
LVLSVKEERFMFIFTSLFPFRDFHCLGIIQICLDVRQDTAWLQSGQAQTLKSGFFRKKSRGIPGLWTGIAGACQVESGYLTPPEAKQVRLKFVRTL